MKKMLGLIIPLLFASFVSANLAISANQIVEGQPVTLNYECDVGQTCRVYYDGVLIDTVIGDSYGTGTTVHAPTLGTHIYSWKGWVYGYPNQMIDSATVTVVENNADTLNGSTLQSIYNNVSAWDAITLANAYSYTNVLQQGLENGSVIVGQAVNAYWADVAGYSLDSDALDGWHGWQYRMYTRYLVLNERNRAVARENQIEADSIIRDNQLQDNIDVVDDKHTAWNQAQDVVLNDHEVRITDLEGKVAQNGESINALWNAYYKLDNRVTVIEGDVYEFKSLKNFNDYADKCGVFTKESFKDIAGRIPDYEESAIALNNRDTINELLNALYGSAENTGFTKMWCTNSIPSGYGVGNAVDKNQDGNIAPDENKEWCVVYPYFEAEREFFGCELEVRFDDLLGGEDYYVIRKEASGEPKLLYYGSDYFEYLNQIERTQELGGREPADPLMCYEMMGYEKEEK